MKDINQINSWIKFSLEKIQEDIKENRFNPQKSKSEIIDSINEIRKDLLEDGESIESSYWNLIMADWNPEEDAVFIATILNLDNMEIIIGRGDKYKIHDICNSYSLADTEEVIIQFTNPEFKNKNLKIEKSLAEFWIETG